MSPPHPLPLPLGEVAERSEVGEGKKCFDLKYLDYTYDAAGNIQTASDGTNTLDFFYDTSGKPYALKYNNTLYYYITNLQGDVLHIVDTYGVPVVSYSYDPYGKPTVTSDTSNKSLGTINPLRYRGYVYDTESGMYYLQSRYYDPEIGRFINADNYTSTGQGLLGYNMFAYCRNNPVCREDASGTDDIRVTSESTEDDNPLNDAGTFFRPGGAGGGGSSSLQDNNPSSNGNDGVITVFRAMSPDEYSNTISSQEFSPGPNSYESGKYFATTYDDAVEWGSKMYADGKYEVLQASFDSHILSAKDTYYFNSLDGIGPAFFFSIVDANFYKVCIY